MLEYDHPDYAYREPEEPFSEEEIDNAVEPTHEDDPWRCDLDKDTGLDEFENESDEA